MRVRSGTQRRTRTRNGTTSSRAWLRGLQALVQELNVPLPLISWRPSKNPMAVRSPISNALYIRRILESSSATHSSGATPSLWPRSTMNGRGVTRFAWRCLREILGIVHKRPENCPSPRRISLTPFPASDYTPADLLRQFALRTGGRGKRTRRVGQFIETRQLATKD